MLSLLALVPLLELAVIPQPVHPVYFSPFFSRIAAEPGDFGILELPVTSHYLRDHSRMINQTVHQKKIIGGYVARRVHDYYLDPASPFYQFIDLNTKPQPDIVPPLSPFAVLNYYNMPYVVVYKVDEGYGQPGDKEAVDAYVRYLFPDRSAIVEDDAQLTAYRVPPTPGDNPLIWVGGGWQAPESNACPHLALEQRAGRRHPCHHQDAADLAPALHRADLSRRGHPGYGGERSTGGQRRPGR